MRLFRVYVHTTGDHSVHEIVVVANTIDDAKLIAKKHVKAGNKGKGDRTKTQSEKLTDVLAVKPASKPYCLEIHSFPLSAFTDIKRKGLS